MKSIAYAVALLAACGPIEKSQGFSINGKPFKTTTSTVAQRKRGSSIASDFERTLDDSKITIKTNVETANMCPISAAIQFFKSWWGQVTILPLLVCTMPTLCGNADLSLEFNLLTCGIAALTITSAMESAFEKVKSCNGPSLRELPKLFVDIRKDGFLKLLETMKEQYGTIFSLGPLTVITGNAKNVDTVFKNSKLPTTLLGLPRDAGLASTNPHTVLEGRKALMSKGTKKEGSHSIIEAITSESEEIMLQAVKKHGASTDGIFRARETILAPIASVTNTEFIFDLSLASNYTQTKNLAVGLQAQGLEITNYFGAKGVLNMLLRPWTIVAALEATKSFLDSLDHTIASADLAPNCPMGQVKSSLSAGKVSKTDALQFASSFIYTGTESIEIVSEGVMWMLSHPENAQLQKECQAEVDQVFGGTHKVVTQGAQLEQFHLLKATVAEGIRCYEFAMPFKLTRDVVLEGQTIKEGSLTLVTGFNNKETSASTGRDEWVQSPSTFNPKVWLNENGSFDEALFHKFNFFGRGAHRCPGRQLGFDTVVSLLATTLSHFEDISFAEGGDVSSVRPESVSQFRDKIQLKANLR